MQKTLMEMRDQLQNRHDSYHEFDDPLKEVTGAFVAGKRMAYREAILLIEERLQP